MCAQARRRGRAAYEASVGQPEMATPGASRQPLACTRLPHKRPTSLGALLRLAVAVVALYVPRAAPARRLRTSLHLRRSPRRAWTRRGAAPRFSRRLRTPNSLYFMAELTERCGVCAKCQWTCADQPDQTACYACKNGGGKRFFQSRSRTAWNRPPCQKPRTFDFTEMEGVLENKTRQPESVRKSNFTASIDDVAPDSLVDLRAGARSTTRRGRRRRPTARPSAKVYRREV